MAASRASSRRAICSRWTRSVVRVNSTRQPFSTRAKPSAAARWLLPPPGGPNSSRLAPLFSQASPAASAMTWALRDHRDGLEVEAVEASCRAAAGLRRGGARCGADRARQSRARPRRPGSVRPASPPCRPARRSSARPVLMAGRRSSASRSRGGRRRRVGRSHAALIQLDGAEQALVDGSGRRARR